MIPTNNLTLFGTEDEIIEAIARLVASAALRRLARKGCRDDSKPPDAKLLKNRQREGASADNGK